MKTTITRRMLGTVAVLMAATVVHANPPMKVYVFTGDGGFVDPGLADSVSDLKDKLHGRDGLVVVETPDADFTLEVMDRQYQQTNSTTSVIGRGLFGGLVASSSPNSAAVLHVRLRVGAYSEVFWASHGNTANRLVLSPWKDDAKSVAGLVEKWVKVNQGRLQARTAAASLVPVPPTAQCYRDIWDADQREYHRIVTCAVPTVQVPAPVQAPASVQATPSFRPVDVLSGRSVSWPLPLQNVASVMVQVIRTDAAEAPALAAVAPSTLPFACQTVPVDRPATWNLMSALSQAQWQRCADIRNQ